MQRIIVAHGSSEYEVKAKIKGELSQYKSYIVIEEKLHSGKTPTGDIQYTAECKIEV
ncbi:hypothetical protein ACU64V_09540 [Lysinibacillus capsici]|uniref:hypothetical protein n=1 Tax=Lysinibacillus capsici TaxID=2115968 RepID=UPI0028E1929D|nr:hypothetical protein [Lysinibacillus capsici]MED3796129.1 hypothetical protein [Lysinibacillus capsici]MED4554491.1 hypothetical protein [Lysinibacillus capsici]